MGGSVCVERVASVRRTLALVVYRCQGSGEWFWVGGGSLHTYILGRTLEQPYDLGGGDAIRLVE
jgi:hypothetical protein